MKKTEKIVIAAAIIVFGILFMILKSNLIGIFMTILGIALFVFGAMDIFKQKVVWAVCKIVFGALAIICGWAMLEAVLYLLSAGLFVLGILILYDLLRYKLNGVVFKDAYCLLKLSQPALCMLIALTFLFEPNDWVFILSGIFMIVEGGLLLFDAIKNE